MSSVIARRRYLSNFEPARLPNLFTDVLVIGSGVAGLRAAIEAAQRCDVLLITKARTADSATHHAQGGIAAALGAADSIELHVADTLRTACGLAHPDVVSRVISEAPDCIAELRRWGAVFDLDHGDLATGREGGHSAARIVHADGDATGRELVRVLEARARACPRLRVFEGCFAIDVLTHEGTALGAVTFHPRFGHQLFWSAATILATGGCGRVFRETTNPAVTVGDGLAMAFRAGAVLRDMEMVQFHPTTLYIAGAARALISEAVRGEGARLLNRAGQRFMLDYHPSAELAPRDVVSRSIATEMQRERATHVFLDARQLPAGRFAERFPNIHRLCGDFDLDPARDLIPVRPTAHYLIGGVAVDADGNTAVPGLLACGEVASSGLHGANRLASNSLLEGLVLGRVTGRAAAQRACQERGSTGAGSPDVGSGGAGSADIVSPGGGPAVVGSGRAPSRPADVAHLLPASSRTEMDLDDVTHSLRAVMARNVGIERSGDRLRETIEIIEFWARYVLDKVFDAPAGWEAQNLLTLAHAIALSAATRCESRGAHYRADFPRAEEPWRRHIDLRRRDDQTQVSTSAVGEAAPPAAA